MWSIPESLDALVLARTIILNSSKMRTASERSHFMGIAEKMVRTARQSLRLKRATEFDAQEVYDTLFRYLETNNRTNLARLVGGLSSSQVAALLDLDEVDSRLTQILEARKSQLSEAAYDDSDDRSSSHYNKLTDKDHSAREKYLEKLNEAELDSLYQYSELMDNKSLSSLIASVLAQKSSRKKRVRTDNVAPKGTSGGYVRKPQPTGELDFNKFQENIMATASWAWSSTWFMICEKNFYTETTRKHLDHTNPIKLFNALKDNTSFYEGTKYDSTQSFEASEKESAFAEILKTTYRALVGSTETATKQVLKEVANQNQGSLAYLGQNLTKGRAPNEKVGYQNPLEAFWDLYVESLTGFSLTEDDDSFEALTKKIFKTNAKLKPHSAFSEIYRDYARMYAKIRAAKATNTHQFEKGTNTVAVRHRKALATCKYLPNKIAQVMKRYAEEFKGRKTVYLEDSNNQQVAGDPLDVEGLSETLDSVLSDHSELLGKLSESYEEMDPDGAGAQTLESRETLPIISELVSKYEEEQNTSTGKEAARLIFENLLNRRLPVPHIRFLLENIQLLTEDSDNQKSANSHIYATLFKRGALTPSEKSFLSSDEDHERVIRHRRNQIFAEKVTARVRDLSSNWLDSVLRVLYREVQSSLMYKFHNSDSFTQQQFIEEFERKYPKLADYSWVPANIDVSSRSIPEGFAGTINDTNRNRILNALYSKLEVDSVLRVFQIAAKVSHLKDFLGSTDALYSGDYNDVLAEEIKGEEIYFKPSENQAINRLQKVNHPLNSFRRDQYESLHKSRLDVSAFNAYLASVIPQEVIENIKDENLTGVQLLDDPRLNQVVQSATQNFIRDHYSSSFLSKGRKRFPDFIHADRIVRDLSKKDNTQDNEESEEVVSSKEVETRRDTALNKPIVQLTAEKDAAVKKYTSSYDISNAESKHMDLFQQDPQDPVALQAARDEILPKRLALYKTLSQGRIDRARKLRVALGLDDKLYTELENAYIEYHLGSDLNARARNEVWTEYSEKIESAQNEVNQALENPNNSEETLLELEGGYHASQIKLKKLYVQRKQSLADRKLAMRREQGATLVMYHPILESKYEMIRNHVLKQVSGALQFAQIENPSEIQKVLKELNKTRAMLGERGVVSILKDARIFSKPTYQTANTFVNFLRNDSYQDMFSFRAGSNLDALCDFILSAFSLKKLCVDEMGETYTPSGLFQNFDLQTEMKDFLRGYYIIQSDELYDEEIQTFTQLTVGDKLISISGKIPSSWKEGSFVVPTYTYMSDKYRNESIQNATQAMNTTYRLAILRLVEVFITPTKGFEYLEKIQRDFQLTVPTKDLYTATSRLLREKATERRNLANNLIGQLNSNTVETDKSILTTLIGRGDPALTQEVVNSRRGARLLQDSYFQEGVGLLNLLDLENLSDDIKPYYKQFTLKCFTYLSLETLVSPIQYMVSNLNSEEGETFFETLVELLKDRFGEKGLLGHSEFTEQTVTVIQEKLDRITLLS